MSEQEPRGTYECPICGFDKPHPHTAEVVEWHRTGNRISPKGSGIVDAQSTEPTTPRMDTHGAHGLGAG